MNSFVASGGVRLWWELLFEEAKNLRVHCRALLVWQGHENSIEAGGDFQNGILIQVCVTCLLAEVVCLRVAERGLRH